MGQIHDHQPVLHIVAIVSRHSDAFTWTIDALTNQFGPVALASDVFDFTETSYYNASMGDDLKKQFVAMERLIAPDTIIESKILTNAMEDDYRDAVDHPEQRPVNLDPGYISPAKLVLATTKDRDHRLFLGRGIYAEVTLHYRSKAWCSSRWTYPDYQREDFLAFFTQCRQYLRENQSANS